MAQMCSFINQICYSDFTKCGSGELRTSGSWKWLLRYNKLRDGSVPKERNVFGKVRENNTKNHQGWDILANLNTSVYSIADGEVVFVCATDVTDYGRRVVIRHDSLLYNGSPIFSFYAHLSSVFVKLGDKVSTDSIIGWSGKSGNASTGLPPAEYHVHFELRTANVNGTAGGNGLDNRLCPGVLFGKIPIVVVHEFRS